MSTLVKIEQAIDRLPDLDVDQLVGWFETRRAILTFWRARGGFGLIDRLAGG